MRRRLTFLMLVGIAVLGTTGSAQPPQDSLDQRPASQPRHFSGMLDDHTPSATVVSGGPYAMHGKWSLNLDDHDGTATFEVVMNMERSDYGIIQGTVNKDDPATRGPHTHHISMTDGVVSTDWATSCPTFSPASTNGFVVRGTAFVAGNGGGAPFGNPSPVTVCIQGNTAVRFSNMTMMIGKPASNHFGVQPINGVVARCADRSGRPSSDCSVNE